MEFIDSLSLLAQELDQTEYGLGWGLTFGLIILGVIAITIPRPRKRLPKDLLALEEEKKKKAKRRKGKKKKKKS